MGEQVGHKEKGEPGEGVGALPFLAPGPVHVFCSGAHVVRIPIVPVHTLVKDLMSFSEDLLVLTLPSPNVTHNPITLKRFSKTNP